MSAGKGSALVVPKSESFRSLLPENAPAVSVGPVGPAMSLQPERGQALVLLLLALTAIFVIGVIVADVGLWLSERRGLQTTADAAALAGAQEIPSSPSAALAAATEWAELNGFETWDTDASCPASIAQRCFEVNTPYQGDPNKIEVQLEEPRPALFGSIFGILSIDIGARAVARRAAGQATYAIFVNNSSCSPPSGLVVSGSNSDVNGLIHSNSEILVSGSTNEFEGPMTYSCNSGFTNSGSDNDYDPPPQQTPTKSMPVNYAFSDFPCDYTYTSDTDLSSRPEVWLNNNPGTKQLKTAVICSTQDLQLGGQDVTGNVTLVAGDELKLSGSNFNLTGYWNNVLFYSSRSLDPAIDVSASGGSWTGIIHAPNGLVKVAGGKVSSDNPELFGSIVADRVEMSGSDFIITAAFVETEGTGISLIE